VTTTSVMPPAARCCIPTSTSLTSSGSSAGAVPLDVAECSVEAVQQTLVARVDDEAVALLGVDRLNDLEGLALRGLGQRRRLIHDHAGDRAGLERRVDVRSIRPASSSVSSTSKPVSSSRLRNSNGGSGMSDPPSARRPDRRHRGLRRRLRFLRRVVAAARGGEQGHRGDHAGEPCPYGGPFHDASLAWWSPRPYGGPRRRGGGSPRLFLATK
jgi:hypothetical protein